MVGQWDLLPGRNWVDLRCVKEVQAHVLHCVAQLLMGLALFVLDAPSHCPKAALCISQF